MESNNIRIEIDKLNARIAELQPEYDALAKAFTAVQTSFASGAISFDGIQAEQAKLNLASQVIDGLSKRVGSLEQEYLAAVESENPEGEAAFYQKIRDNVRAGSSPLITDAEMNQRFDRQSSTGIKANWEHLDRQSRKGE